MRKMCLIIVTALIIIICVIAFKSFTKEKEASFDGIFVEKNIDRECGDDNLMGEVV